MRTSATSKVWSTRVVEHAWALLGHAMDRSLNEGWLTGDLRDATTLWPDEVSLAFERQSRRMITPLPAPIEAGLCASSPESLYEDLLNDVERLVETHHDPGALVWLDLTQRLKLERIEAQTMLLLVALNIDQALARAFRYAWANMMQESPSVGYLARVLGGEAGQLEAIERLTSGTPMWASCGVVTLSARSPQTPRSEYMLTMHYDVVRWLLGAPISSPSWIAVDDFEPIPNRLAAGMGGRLRRALSTRTFAIVGPTGSGRLAFAGQIAQGLGMRGGAWIIDLGRASRLGQLETSVEQATRAALIGDGIIVVDADELGQERDMWIERTQALLHSFTGGLVWLLTQEHPSLNALAPEGILSTTYPNKAERLERWTEHLGEHLERDELVALSGRFLLAEAHIDAAARRAHALGREPETSVFQVAISSARQYSRSGLGSLASPEPGRVSMDRLVLDTETTTALKEIVSYSQHRDTLADAWGFSDAMSYGLGVTCLFAGPSGTGKTFAAQALATTLDLELYRVDLSQLVSKYIGETEKHLSSLFTAAESGEIMLLFDEADSLFAKRTEVKSSVDRYANLEVNYLLQRIERFTGIVVLTTNLEASIDDAFARRIRFRVRFEAPDLDARLRLWRSLIPAGVPKADDLDLEVLAEHYELSGGHIKEVILRAASLAVDAEEGLLTQEFLVRSARVEYRKLGKLMNV